MARSKLVGKFVLWRTGLEAKMGGRYTTALISLLIALTAYPLTGHIGWSRLLVDFWMFVSLAFLLISLREHDLSRLEVLALGSITIGLLLLNLASGLTDQFPVLIYLLLLPFSVLFFFRCAWLIIATVFKEKQVSTDMICGAVLAYLLIGIGWSALYGIISLTVPGAFHYPEGISADRGASLVYFSFVTMTTLGYGDVRPLAEIARTAAYLQAVAGVMFGAIFVAAVVGNWQRK